MNDTGGTVLAAERRDVIRSLNTAYQALVRVEGVSTTVDAATDAVQAAILDYCPDATEYDRVTKGHRDYERYTYPAEQSPHARIDSSGVQQSGRRDAP